MRGGPDFKSPCRHKWECRPRFVQGYEGSGVVGGPEGRQLRIKMKIMYCPAVKVCENPNLKTRICNQPIRIRRGVTFILH